MSKTKIMDGHEYFLREDGLWEAKDWFAVNELDWVFNGEHPDHVVIFEVRDGQKCPRIVCDDVNLYSAIYKVHDSMPGTELTSGYYDISHKIGGLYQL